jgi:hypothetical protein
MKKLPKILTIIFFVIFILQMACLILLLALPEKTRAADVEFTPQISIPGSSFQEEEATSPSIAKYIQAIYNYAIGIVGILAAVVLMFGGLRWLTSRGKPDNINDAKAWIWAAVSGLVLALTSYMILNTINPDLVSFKEITPKIVTKEDASVGAFDAEGVAKKFCCQAELDLTLSTTEKYACAFYQHTGDITIGEKEQWIMSEEVCRNFTPFIDAVRVASFQENVNKTTVTFIEVSDTGGCHTETGKCVIKE